MSTQRSVRECSLHQQSEMSINRWLTFDHKMKYCSEIKRIKVIPTTYMNFKNIMLSARHPTHILSIYYRCFIYTVGLTCITILYYTIYYNRHTSHVIMITFTLNCIKRKIIVTGSTIETGWGSGEEKLKGKKVAWGYISG